MTSTLSSLVNHQVRLASRPVGLPNADNWQFSSEPVAEPGAGGVLVKTLALSLDPAMRGWMNEGKSYIPPVGIGEVMRAGGVGVVIASQHPDFAVGDHVAGGAGVQEYFSVAGDQIQLHGLVRGNAAAHAHHHSNIRQTPGHGHVVSHRRLMGPVLRLFGSPTGGGPTRRPGTSRHRTPGPTARPPPHPADSARPHRFG